MRDAVSKSVSKGRQVGPGQRNSPGRVGRRGAVTCGVVSTNNVRPEGFEPPTF